MYKILAFVSTAFVVSACSSMPSGGPTLSQISAEAYSGPAETNYEVIDITPAVSELVSKSVAKSSSGQFSRLAGRTTRGIGVGDTVEITLYESASGGLFAPGSETGAGGMPQVKLPPQVVDHSGMITVPYAGSVKASGQTPRQVQTAIVKRLSGRAMEPQAIVSVVANESRLITVTGDVERAGRFPLNTGSERLLDVLALAGSARGRPEESFVKLTRGSHSEKMLLSDLANSPKNNIVVQPGDQIFVYQNPQKFVALGASLTNSEISFSSNSLTLSEAIGRAGGLDDRRSDPAGVFVFRYESREVYERLIGTDDGSSHGYSIVYRLDLRNPKSFLAAQRFPIKNKDIVYFAHSPSTELSKFLTLLGAGFGIAGQGSATVVRVTQ